MPGFGFGFGLDKPSAAGPVPVTGLQLWLKPETLQSLANGATVNPWPDSSGKGRHATWDGISGPPTYAANLQNGKGGLFLNFTQLSGSVSVVGTECSAYEVWGFVAGSQAYCYGLGLHPAVGSGGADCMLLVRNVANESVEVSRNGIDHMVRPVTYGTRFIQAVRWSAAQGNNTVNGGTPAVVGAWGAGPFNITRYRMGANENASGEWISSGWICEVIVYDRYVLDAEHAQITNYLKNKYAL